MQQRQGVRSLKKGGRRPEYDLSFMRMVVRQYRSGDLSMSQLVQKHSITIGQLKGWLVKYSSDISDQIPTPVILTEQERHNIEVLKKQNEDLAKKLSYAQLKITGLELMIDIAEEQLNIDIRKKPDTKQSKG